MHCGFRCYLRYFQHLAAFSGLLGLLIALMMRAKAVGCAGQHQEACCNCLPYRSSGLWFAADTATAVGSHSKGIISVLRYHYFGKLLNSKDHNSRWCARHSRDESWQSWGSSLVLNVVHRAFKDMLRTFINISSLHNGLRRSHNDSLAKVFWNWGSRSGIWHSSH